MTKAIDFLDRHGWDMDGAAIEELLDMPYEEAAALEQAVWHELAMGRERAVLRLSTTVDTVLSYLPDGRWDPNDDTSVIVPAELAGWLAERLWGCMVAARIERIFTVGNKKEGS